MRRLLGSSWDLGESRMGVVFAGAFRLAEIFLSLFMGQRVGHDVRALWPIHSPSSTLGRLIDIPLRKAGA